MKESEYKSKSSSSWEGSKAVLIQSLKNIGGEKLKNGTEVLILGKSEKRIYLGKNLNAFMFDIKCTKTGVIMYGAHCSILKTVKYAD